MCSGKLLQSLYHQERGQVRMKATGIAYTAPTPAQRPAADAHRLPWSSPLPSLHCQSSLRWTACVHSLGPKEKLEAQGSQRSSAIIFLVMRVRDLVMCRVGVAASLRRKSILVRRPALVISVNQSKSVLSQIVTQKLKVMLYTEVV